MSTASLWTVYSLVFLDFLGFGICLPILPFLLPSAAANGVLIAAFSIAQGVGSVWWGRLADKIGRRPCLLIALAGSGASFVAYAVAVSFLSAGSGRTATVVAARVLGGLCG